MTAVDLALARLPSEEGVRKFAYNDATGKQVTCKPDGNLSIAIGINLETGLDAAEIAMLTQHRLGLVEQQLLGYAWYAKCDDVRKSVLLDIAFNEGVGGLLHFPHMLAAIANDNWAEAKAQCAVQDPRLKARYDALGDLLLKGENSGT